MKNFTNKAKSYVAQHQKPLSSYIHYVSVPLLLLSLMIFCSFFQIGIVNVLNIDFATVGVLALIIYYFMQDWRLAIPVTVVLLILLWIATLFAYAGPTAVAVWAFIITFILGAGGMLAGYYMEDKQPGWVEGACQLLVAPLVIMAELFFMINWFPELKKTIYGKEKSSK